MAGYGLFENMLHVNMIYKLIIAFNLNDFADSK